MLLLAVLLLLQLLAGVVVQYGYAATADGCEGGGEELVSR
jgi:hypothetical protein